MGNRGNQNRPSSGTNTSSWTNPSSGDSGNPFDNNTFDGDFFRQHAPTAAANWRSAAASWRSGENHYENININTGIGAGVIITTSSSTTANGQNNNYNVPVEINIIDSTIGKFIEGKNITENEKKEVYQGGSSKFTMDAKNSEFKDSKVGPGDFNITRGSGETQRETPEELVCWFLKMTKVTKDQLVKLLSKGYKFEDMVKKFPATDPEKSEKILKELLS